MAGYPREKREEGKIREGEGQQIVKKTQSVVRTHSQSSLQMLGFKNEMKERDRETRPGAKGRNIAKFKGGKGVRLRRVVPKKSSSKCTERGIRILERRIRMEKKGRIY